MDDADAALLRQRDGEVRLVTVSMAELTIGMLRPMLRVRQVAYRLRTAIRRYGPARANVVEGEALRDAVWNHAEIRP